MPSKTLNFEARRTLLESSSQWGFGLRSQHASELLHWPELPVLELLVDNYIFQRGGPNLEQLTSLQGRGEILLHGIGLNLGGPDALDKLYMREVKKLCARTGCKVYSDHLAFSQMDGHCIYDLLPIPRTPSQLQRLIGRVKEVQDSLGMQLGIENTSAYLAYPDPQIPELEFLQALVEATGCGILLDLNNLYVNAHNFNFNAEAALKFLDADAVIQFHISGHRLQKSLLHDTHDQQVIEAVWQLLDLALERFGSKPVILERDDDEVSLAEILAELCRGLGRTHGRRAAETLVRTADSGSELRL